MRKTTKGAIAVGAGVALLLGGAGTLAAWRVDANLNNGTAQTVSSGNLNLVANNDGRWFWGNAACDAPLNTTTIAVTGATAVAIVPGDCVVYQETVTVDAKGDNLQAAVITATPTVTGTLPVAAPLKNYLTVTLHDVVRRHAACWGHRGDRPDDRSVPLQRRRGGRVEPHDLRDRNRDDDGEVRRGQRRHGEPRRRRGLREHLGRVDLDQADAAGGRRLTERPIDQMRPRS